MRIRLIGLIMCLMAIALAALGIPLGDTIRNAYARDMFLDRLNDTARFAAIAQQADESKRLASIGPELARYRSVYGIDCYVLGANRDIRLRTSTAQVPADSIALERIAAAFGGRRSEPPDAQWPWRTEKLVVAEPLVRGGDVVGALITVSPTDQLQRRVWLAWLLLLGLGLGALVICYFLADRLARWVLRPVAVLDSVSHQVSTGRFDARVPAGAGPPELRRLVSSFNEMADHVETSLDQQRDFVADASHQLRNPLSALLLRMDDVAMRAPAELQPDADKALEEGRRLAGILERLLELARAERMVANLKYCDIESIANERLGCWQPIAAARQLSVHRTGLARMSAWADEAAVAGALDALLDNACKFAPAGSSVSLSLFVARDGAVISVRDHGPGLTEEELSRVGNRFWRSSSQQNVAGFGLGLSIARALLEPGGGSLRIIAPDSGGLDVRLQLRREPVNPSTGDTSAARQDAVAPDPSRSRFADQSR